MKMIVLLSILILLTGCAVKDCKVNPQVSIQTNSKETQSNSDSESKVKNPKSIIKDIQDNAQPGGQVNCKF
jgi:hypothetical protein